LNHDCCINDTGSADEAVIVEESILHAKQAVSLDIKDGQSWCTIPFNHSELHLLLVYWKLQINRHEFLPHSSNLWTDTLYTYADTLGNAYLTSFFVSGAWDRNKLHQSLKSYQNAVSESIGIS